jgi:acetyltransferase-like isoleucine patch superfamily enzyme
MPDKQGGGEEAADFGTSNQLSNDKHADMTNSNNDAEKSGRIGKSAITVGRYTYGFENLSIRQWGEGASLRIGAFCSLAGATIMLGGNHRTDWITTFPFGHIFADELGGQEIVGHPATRGDVVIGNDVWIGHNATIMSGITIGTGAVIASNAVVVKDVRPYDIVGGNPAKCIKTRFDEDIVERLLQLRWWDLPVEDIRQVAATLSQAPTPQLLDGLIAKYRPGPLP